VKVSDNGTTRRRNLPPQELPSPIKVSEFHDALNRSPESRSSLAPPNPLADKVGQGARWRGSSLRDACVICLTAGTGIRLCRSVYKGLGDRDGRGIRRGCERLSRNDSLFRTTWPVNRPSDPRSRQRIGVEAGVHHGGRSTAAVSSAAVYFRPTWSVERL